MEDPFKRYLKSEHTDRQSRGAMLWKQLYDWIGTVGPIQWKSDKKYFAPGYHGFQLRRIAKQNLGGVTAGGRDAFVDFWEFHNVDEGHFSSLPKTQVLGSAKI